jgi:hypothetical protein
MKKIDITKPVRTVIGKKPVEIISDKGRGGFPYVGYLSGSNVLAQWSEAGIENVPEKTVKYLNMFSDGSYCIHITKDIADKFAGPNRLSCLRIEYEEGQFDE